LRRLVVGSGLMGDAEVAMQMLLYIEKETQPYPRYTYIVLVESIDVILK
jgi:hypothetical protein